MPRIPRLGSTGSTGKSQNVRRQPRSIGMTLSTPGFDQIQNLINVLNPELNAEIWNTGLTRIVLHLQAETVKTNGGHIRFGVAKDAPAIPGTLTNRHGGSGLVGSISPDYSGLPRLASLGSDLPYAGVHEDSPRAYLLPTYDTEERSGKLRDLMLQTLEELAGLVPQTAGRRG